MLKKEVKLVETEKIAEVEGLRIWYDNGDPVVDGVSFELNEGDLLLLVGKTGAGKTSILNALAGNIPRLISGRAEGRLLIRGRDPRISDSSELLSLVGIVPQEPWSGVIGDTVEDEILISKMLGGSEEDEIELSRKLKLDRLYDRTTFTLSAGETQKLAILSRILLNVDVLLLDEPTTYLDEASRMELKEIVRELISIGKAIVVTSHDESFWEGIPSRIVELKKEGESREIEKIAEISVEKISETPRIEVRDLEHRYYPVKKPIFKKLNLKLEESGIYILRGSNGTGKTTLLKLLAGIEKPRKGKVTSSHPPLFLPDNPLLFFSRPTAYEEIQSSLKNNSLEELRQLSLFRKRLKELSSGERRLISLISASLSSKPILLLDEPTVGLDPEYRDAVMEIFKKLADSGRMLVISTHDRSLESIASKVLDIEELRGEEC